RARAFGGSVRCGGRARAARRTSPRSFLLGPLHVVVALSGVVRVVLVVLRMIEIVVDGCGLFRGLFLWAAAFTLGGFGLEQREVFSLCGGEQLAFGACGARTARFLALIVVVCRRRLGFHTMVSCRRCCPCRLRSRWPNRRWWYRQSSARGFASFPPPVRRRSRSARRSRWSGRASSTEGAAEGRLERWSRA